MGVGNLSDFTISLLVVGVVVVVAFFIIGSFQTTLTKNGEGTPAVNASITDTNNSFSIIQNMPPVIIGIALFLILIFFRFGRSGREEARD
jgi:type II secretory pathway component PulF